MSVRTSVELEKIGSLLEGRHENPFDVLGPHEIEVDGRRALAVRAFLPDIDPGLGGRPRPAASCSPCGASIRPACTRPFARC